MSGGAALRAAWEAAQQKPSGGLKAAWEHAQGPITPGHSKFTPAELQQHADKSVDDATQATMDAQGDLIRTVQSGVAAGELPLLAKDAAMSVPALVRAGSKVSRMPSAVLNAVRAARGLPIPEVEAATVARAQSAADAVAPKALTDAPKTLLPPPTTTHIQTQSPIATALDAPRPALDRQFQNVVDEGKAGYDASLHKGTVTSDPPDNPDLMRRIEESLRRAKAERPPFRPTGGQSSGRSVADVPRAKRAP